MRHKDAHVQQHTVQMLLSCHISDITIFSMTAVWWDCAGPSKDLALCCFLEMLSQSLAAGPLDSLEQ